MLYDQAQLLDVYTVLYQATKNPFYDEVYLPVHRHSPLTQQVAADIVHYVEKNLSQKSGGFFSAEDADSLPTPDSKEKRGKQA